MLRGKNDKEMDSNSEKKGKGKTSKGKVDEEIRKTQELKCGLA